MKNVLIVEDDRLLALMLEDVLLQSGYRVEHAFDLEEGDAVVDAKPIDAAILDIRVEGGLSFELARKLDRLHIPYLFASSARRLDMPPDLRWRPLIGKPYTASQVVTALEALCGAIYAGKRPLRPIGPGQQPDL